MLEEMSEPILLIQQWPKKGHFFFNFIIWGKGFSRKLGIITELIASGISEFPQKTKKPPHRQGFSDSVSSSCCSCMDADRILPGFGLGRSLC
jgi:hypothetical protein